MCIRDRGEFIGQPVFSQFDETPIAPEEAYAVNCLFVNGKVLLSLIHISPRAR